MFDEWIKKMWCGYIHTCMWNIYIYIYIYIILVIKKNEIMPFAATWMELREVSQKKTNTI